MQSAKERSRLQERYGADEPRPLLAVLKCVIGLVVLCAVAAAPWLLASLSGEGAVEAHTVQGAPQPFPSSMAESQRIFDERRSRHEARAARPGSTQGAALAHELEGKATPGGEPAGYRGSLIP